MKILIVDDQPINLKLLQVILETEGHQLCNAHNGLEALAVLAQGKVDAIISDIMMPHMDGYQLCAEVRKRPEFCEIPFIFYSATFTSPADEKLCYSLGADKYLRKPASAEELFKALDESVNSGPQRRIENLNNQENSQVMKQYSEQLVLKLEEKNRELKATLDRLHANDERFRQVVENIGEVSWMTDTEKNQMIYISPGYEKIWGRSVQSLYENPANWQEAIHPSDRETVIRTAHQQSETYDIEYRILRPDSSIRWIHDRAFPVKNDHGEVYRVVGVATDITDRKNIEEQLRQAQKMEAIGLLSAGIAHDFNNLLTIILGNLFLLKVSDFEPEVANPLLEIRHASEQAANLTRQLLLFARRQKMQITKIELNTAVAETIRLLGRILGEDIRLDFQPFSEPLMISADRGMLDQVLMNLAVNARDAMPKGGRFSIQTSKISSGTEIWGKKEAGADQEYVCVTVADNGPGISAEILPKIFDPFFTTKELGKGTGLGLATVFGIIEQHHGRIFVNSKEGDGTTFLIYLPLIKEKKKAVIQNSSGEVEGGTETILLVEDETAIASLLSKYLTHLGYTVLVASDGPEAVTEFGEHQDEISLVFTDLVMPGGMHGVELAEVLQARKPGLRFVFSSGFSDQINALGTNLTEGVNFLAKPFNLANVAKIIRRQLDKKAHNINFEQS